MVCTTPALPLLHLLRPLGAPHTVSVKLCVSGSSSWLCLNTLAKGDWREPLRSSIPTGWAPCLGAPVGAAPRGALVCWWAETVRLGRRLYPALQGFCLLRFCLIKKNLDFSFFHCEKLSSRGMQGGQLFRLQLHTKNCILGGYFRRKMHWLVIDWPSTFPI